jgi:hypothetical protein
MKFAAMAVDPGGTTGVAEGLFNAGRADSTAGLLRRAVRKNALRVYHVEGDYSYQARVLARAWRDFSFYAVAERGIPAEAVVLVFETFALRQRSVDLAPVKVTSGFVTLAGFEPIYQEPSEAMTYATNERLKLWGAYPLTVGKEHARDALRHLTLRASKALNGELRPEVDGSG